ncbi:unnamed protein product [Lactuca virosa]|uniref:Uncharacterized protein n=1 Tax=Lactuca virosa TaxID=75947 RepID=A0AAU9NRN1_9ASTR|nr:unnamed protein product [Lactuca virosa]
MDDFEAPKELKKSGMYTDGSTSIPLSIRLLQGIRNEIFVWRGVVIGTRMVQRQDNPVTSHLRHRLQGRDEGVDLPVVEINNSLMLHVVGI